MLFDIKNKLVKNVSVFTVFIFILISFFTLSLVKHQTVSLQKQIIRVEVIGKAWENNYSQFEGYRPPHWLVQNLKIGATEKSPDGRVVAEILDIEYFERNAGNSQVFVEIEIETVDNFSSGRTIYKGKNIEVGESIDFHFNKTKVLGQIIDISDERITSNTKNIIVTGLYKNISVSLVNKLFVGDQVINPFNNNVYATILEKKLYPSSDKVFYEYGNQSTLRLRTDYSLKNIQVKVELAVEEVFGTYYFSGHQPVKAGTKVYVFFPRIDLGMMEVIDVTNIEESTK